MVPARGRAVRGEQRQLRVLRAAPGVRLQERHPGHGQPRRVPRRPAQGQPRPRRRRGLPGAALRIAHSLHQHHLHRADLPRVRAQAAGVQDVLLRRGGLLRAGQPRLRDRGRGPRADGPLLRRGAGRHHGDDGAGGHLPQGHHLRLPGRVLPTRRRHQLGAQAGHHALDAPQDAGALVVHGTAVVRLAQLAHPGAGRPRSHAGGPGPEPRLLGGRVRGRGVRPGPHGDQRAGGEGDQGAGRAHLQQAAHQQDAAAALRPAGGPVPAGQREQRPHPDERVQPALRGAQHPQQQPAAARRGRALPPGGAAPGARGDAQPHRGGVQRLAQLLQGRPRVGPQPEEATLVLQPPP